MALAFWEFGVTMKQVHTSPTALKGNNMQGPTRERWQELCAQATVEKDPKKLLELAAEINRLLQQKENRLLTEQQRARGESA
jgi:hypothetical protein